MPFGGLLSRRPSSRKSRESGVYYYSTPAPQYQTTSDDRGSIYSGSTLSTSRTGANNSHNAAFQAANAAALSRSKAATTLSSNAAAAALKKHSSMNSLSGISAYNAGLGSRPQSQSGGLAAGRTMSLSSRSFRAPDSPSVQRRTSSFQPGTSNPYLTPQRQPSQQRSNVSRTNSLSSRSSLRPGASNSSVIGSRSNSLTSNSSRARGSAATTTTTTTTTTTKPTATGGTSTTVVRTTKEQDADGRTKSITKTTIHKLGTYEVVKTTVIKPSERTQTRHSNAAAASYAGSILSDHTNDLESITEEFDPEFYQDFDENPGYRNTIDDIVYEEPEEEELFYEEEYPSVPASPLPQPNNRTLNLTGATKDTTPINKKRISSSNPSSANVSPVIVKNEFEAPVGETSDDIVDEVYDSYHEEIDNNEIDNNEIDNNNKFEEPIQNENLSENVKGVSEDSKNNKINADGTHSYRKLTQAGFSRPSNTIDAHHSKSPVRSILKKSSNIAMSATAPTTSTTTTTSESESTNPTLYENGTNKTSLSYGSGDFASANSSNTNKKQIKKMHVDYDDESDESLYSDAVEDLKGIDNNGTSQTYKDSEKVTEEVRSYQSPNINQRAAFRQQTQQQLQQPQRVRSNSINSHNSSTIRKSVKIADNRTEIKSITPSAPKAELTEAEMMEQAMAIAMKKVYGDRLITNNNDDNYVEAADTTMDSDTQKNTLLNSKASTNGRTLSMTSQSYLPKQAKNGRTLSMTSQTASNFDASSNNNYHYSSNATGLGFRTHSLRDMPNNKELKKLSKQKAKDEAKKKKELLKQQKQDSKNLAKAREQAKVEVDNITADQQLAPSLHESTEQDSVIETPIVHSVQAGTSAPLQSKAQLQVPKPVKVSPVTVPPTNSNGSVSAPEEQKKKRFFSFSSKKKEKPSTPAAVPISLPITQPVVSTPTVPISQASSAPLSSSTAPAPAPTPVPAPAPTTTHRSSVTSRSSFSQPSPAAAQRVPASPKKSRSRLFSKQEKSQKSTSNGASVDTASRRSSANYITMALPDGTQKFETPPSLISKDSLQIHRDDVEASVSNEHERAEPQAQRKPNVGSKIMKLFNL